MKPVRSKAKLQEVNHLLSLAGLADTALLRVSSYGGWVNTVYRLVFCDGTKLVLRIYNKNPEICSREVAVIRQIKESGVDFPIPEIIHHDSSCLMTDKAFVIYEYVPGKNLAQQFFGSNSTHFAGLGLQIGRQIAELHTISSNSHSNYWISQNGNLASEREFVLGRLASALEKGVSAGLINAAIKKNILRGYFHENLFEQRYESCLIHGDIHGGNICVDKKNGVWSVTSFLDFECGMGASREWDFVKMFGLTHCENKELEKNVWDSYFMCNAQLERLIFERRLAWLQLILDLEVTASLNTVLWDTVPSYWLPAKHRKRLFAALKNFSQTRKRK